MRGRILQCFNLLMLQSLNTLIKGKREHARPKASERVGHSPECRKGARARSLARRCLFSSPNDLVPPSWRALAHGCFRISGHEFLYKRGGY